MKRRKARRNREYKGRLFNAEESLRRQMAAKLLREQYGFKPEQVGVMLGVHRTTVIYYLNAINDALSIYKSLRKQYKDFCEEFNSKPQFFNTNRGCQKIF